MKKAKQSVEELKKQLLEAQAQLDKLQLKNTALETMINIAEKQLNVDIRKKSGSKQSKNWISSGPWQVWALCVDCLERLGKPIMKPLGGNKKWSMSKN